MKNVILKKRDGSNIEGELKILDVTYIDKIMELQKKVYEKLTNKDLYVCSEKQEFVEAISSKGKVVGCVSLHNNELIALGVYIEYGYDKHNYGYDIDIQGKELLRVGQVEATIVNDEYRGNGLQKLMCEVLEEISCNKGMEYICATVAPDNKYSLNTFIKLGYEILIEKLKYNGLKRYVLMKKL